MKSKEDDTTPIAIYKDHDSELNHFCETCDQFVCGYCTTNGHNGHVHNSVKETANKHMKELEKMIDDLSTLHQKVLATEEEIGTQQQKLINRLTCIMKKCMNNCSKKEKS